MGSAVSGRGAGDGCRPGGTCRDRASPVRSQHPGSGRGSAPGAALLLRELFLDQHVLGSGGQAHNLAVSFNATLRCVALACRQTDFFSTRLL